METVDLTGEADKKRLKHYEVNPKELAMGIKIEMEHTKDPAVARQVAMDHLAELPNYYTHLKQMEKDAEVKEMAPQMRSAGVRTIPKHRMGDSGPIMRTIKVTDKQPKGKEELSYTHESIEEMMRSLCEGPGKGFNPYDAPKMRSKMTSIAKKYQNSIKKSLRSGKDNLNRRLDDLQNKNEALAGSIAASRITADKYIKERAGKVKSLVNSKIASLRVNESMDFAEVCDTALLVQEVFDEVSTELNEDWGVIFPHMKAAIKGKEVKKAKDPNDEEQVVIMLYSIIGVGILIIINTALAIAFAAAFGPAYGVILSAVVSAPLFEELYKVVGQQLTGTAIPAAIFSIIEMFLYIGNAAGVAMAIGNPISGLVMVLFAVIVRVWCADSHMITARMYRADYDKYGHVRGITYIKGVGMHFLWNTVASVSSLMTAVGGALSKVAPAASYLGLSVLIGLSAKAKGYIAKTVARLRSSKKAKKLREYILFNQAESFVE